MTTLAEFLAAMNRQPIWVLELTMDYCTLTNGVGLCVDGSPCYYTFPTCKDQAHYSKTTKTYKFCEREGKWLSGCLPYIKSISPSPAAIDIKSGKVKRGDLTIELWDDAPMILANEDRSVSVTESAGTFWRNWLARNSNYYRRSAKLYLAFPGLAEASWQLFFNGVIEDITTNSGITTISIKDTLKALDMDSHIAANDACVLYAEYNGGSTVQVVNSGSLATRGILFTENGKYIRYSGITGGAGYSTLGSVGSPCTFIFGSNGIQGPAFP